MLNPVISYNYKSSNIYFQARRCKISKCHADCCYNAPLPLYYLEKYKDKIVNKVYRTIPLGNVPERGGFQVFPVTILKSLKHKCPFLTAENKCNIYEDRPLICKEYGTEDSGTLYCNLMK